MRITYRIFTIALLTWSFSSFAQSDLGQIHGNVSLLWQQYNADSLIGATVPPEKTGFNAFGNLIYTKGDFSAGVRMESYLPPVQGYPGRFKGTGLGYRYARYKHKKFDVTIGNFYDQFGSGMVFRSYEERNLGIDNAMDGFRVEFRPFDGFMIKGIYGRQRLDFDSRIINGTGITRGVDGEIDINDLFKSLNEKKTRVSIGGSFVSKFQSGGIIEKDTLLLELPENVCAKSLRLGVIRGGFTFSGEYVTKINDPSADNGFIYRDGEGVLVNLAYSQRGMGISLGGKMVDNMSYRSDRNLLLFDAPINFIPAATKPHTYNLVATLYPYATVINGETSVNAEVFYKFKKNTFLGGKYGTNITIGFAAANNLDTTHLAGVEGEVDGYIRNGYGVGDEKYVRDLNIELKKKINKKLKLKYTFYDIEFNTLATPVTTDFKGIVYADIHVLEVNYKIKPKHSLRGEFQALFTEQDKKDWATVLLEYNWSPHWTFTLVDQYNYGNDDTSKRVHYLYGTMSYIDGANRISLGYGKRREGIFCAGGVCRAVPASNGFEITLTSSF